ncbi:MAG: TolC family protein [Acidobacteria bacterium]|nr:TolC family protein [Acidobacteriota bacterium]
MRLRIVLWVALPLWAQDTLHLTLQEAVAMALRQNPSLAAVRQAVEEADARIKQARSNFFPQLGFNGIGKAGLSGATNGLGLIGLPNSPFYRNFADSLNASYRASDFGRTRHSVRLERRRREVAEADVRAAEASVSLSVERAFYGLLRARRLREVAAEIVRSREQTVRQAQAFYEGQIRSRVDLDLARAHLAKAQLGALEAANAVREAVAELGRALGASQEANYELQTPDLSLQQPDPLPKLIEDTNKMRPALQSLRAEHEAALEAVALARSQRKPFLSFVFSSGYARFTNVLARQLLAGGAGLILPLFTGGNLEGQLEEAEARLRRLESRLDDLSQQVALETRTAYFRLQNAQASIPTRQQQADYARSAARLARARYRERLGSMVELSQAEAALAEAEATQAAAVFQAKTAEAELRFAAGRD